MHTLNIRQALVFLLLSIFSLAAQAQIQFNEPDLLQVDQAFPAIITNDDSAVLVNFKVAPAYYLYKHAFEFTANNGVQLGEAVIPKGKEKMDEYFGWVFVYPLLIFQKARKTLLLPFVHKAVQTLAFATHLLTKKV